MNREYTITEALQECKLLTKRINKEIETTTFISAKRNEDKHWEQCQDAPSIYQSIIDLINRRTKIKNAIILSNATTQVEIDGKYYTVAEVIAQKEYISEKENLLETLKRQYAHVQDEISRYQVNRQNKIDSLITTTFGRDSSKSNIEDIKNITEVYQKQYNIELIDPLNLKDKISLLETEINNFTNTCDFKLSYINAITKISIPL